MLKTQRDKTCFVKTCFYTNKSFSISILYKTLIGWDTLFLKQCKQLVCKNKCNATVKKMHENIYNEQRNWLKYTRFSMNWLIQ